MQLEAGIVARNYDTLQAFYVEAFGFELQRSYSFDVGTVHRFASGGARLKIFQPKDRMPDGLPLPDPWWRRGGLCYVALYVADVVAVATAVAAAGGDILVPARRHRPNAVGGIVADPEQNVIELLQEA